MTGEYALSPQGDLDMAAVPRLEREVREVVEHYHPRRLVIDLSEVPFLDCSGIGLLLRAHKRLRADGGRLEVTNARELPRRVLALTGTDAVLGMDASCPAAAPLAQAAREPVP